MEIRDNIYGHGEEELQYLLFHKLTADPVISNEAQFYYNTTDELPKIHTSASWVYLPIVETLSATLRIAALTNGTVSQLRQSGTAVNVFLKLDPNDEPVYKDYIEYSDLDSGLLCTTITGPGDNITLTTEKAVVDYVNSVISTISSVAGNNREIQYNDNGDFGASENFKFRADYNQLELLGVPNNEGTIKLSIVHDEIIINGYISCMEDCLRIYSEDVGIYISTLNRIDLISTDGDIYLDSALITLNSNRIELSKGTINKYLYLDSNREISYVDGPTGSGTVSGTANTLAMFTDTDVLGDSNITFDGTDTITIDNNLEITGILYKGVTPSYSFNPGVANGASAVAYILNTENTLSNASSKILSILNNGTQRMALKGTGQLILDSYGDGTFISIAPTVYLCSTSAGLIVEQNIGVSDEFTAGTKTIRVTNGLITEIV